MVYDAVGLPLYGVLVAVLVFNLTQRNHLEHGEAKRFASLGIAGLILLLAVELFLIRWYELPEAFALAALLPPAVLAHVLRRRLFIFRTRCVSCKAALPVRRILYYDDGLCPECDTSRRTLDQAGARSTQFPAGVPSSVEEVDWESWVPDETAVLCFVHRGDELLLIHKKTGLGAGKINAPGGRIEPGESAEAAAVRETQEETGVTPSGLELRVELSFIFTNGYSLRGSVFFANEFTGTPAETAEAAPFWCSRNELPFDRMWEDDREWLPRALEGERLDARFIFDGERMVSSTISKA